MTMTFYTNKLCVYIKRAPTYMNYENGKRNTKRKEEEIMNHKTEIDMITVYVNNGDL